MARSWLHHPQGSGLDQLDGRGAGLADAVHRTQFGFGRADDAAEAAEAGQQVTGDGFGVTAGQGDEQDHLQHLVIGQCVGAGFQQALAHARAMAVGTDRAGGIKVDGIGEQPGQHRGFGHFSRPGRSGRMLGCGHGPRDGNLSDTGGCRED